MSDIIYECRKGGARLRSNICELIAISKYVMCRGDSTKVVSKCLKYATILMSGSIP